MKAKDKDFFAKIKLLLDVRFDDNKTCSDTAVKLIKLNFESIPSENILASNKKLNQWLTVNEDNFEFIKKDGVMKIRLRKN